MSAPVPSGRRFAAGAALALTLAWAPGAAQAAARLDWRDCGGGFQCAVAAVPVDYGNPSGAKLDVSVTRLPHTGGPGQFRGPLFFNFGGPGDAAAETLRLLGADEFADVRENFDVIGVDPRGTGPGDALDCKVNQFTQGILAKPFWTADNTTAAGVAGRANRLVRRCLAENAGLPLASFTTGNDARDLDAVRAALGGKLNLLAFSYGSFLGETYATLFPGNYRAMVLDGVFDPDVYINRPTVALSMLAAGAERALGRFFQACAANKGACPFDAADPHAAYDQLLEAADARPLPGFSRPVDGDDIRTATLGLLYAKASWPFLAAALDGAEHGDATLLQLAADAGYGAFPDGSFDAFNDRYLLLSAIEQRYPTDVATFLDLGQAAFDQFDHFWSDVGYFEAPFGLLGITPSGAYRGPFRVPQNAPWILAVSNTYDPITPYRGAKAAVKQLGRARLLTMRGDGHTAFPGNSACIDQAVLAYLVKLTLPSKGTTCRQDVPFGSESAAKTTELSAQSLRRLLPARPHMKPFVGGEVTR